MKPAKPFIFILGILSLLLGFIGAFLPILPTTPFLILAAYLFSKSSPAMHQWLLNLPTFGPAIKNWEDNGCISPSAKRIATISIVLLFSISLYLSDASGPVKFGIGGVGIAVLSFIWSRPSFPPV